MCLPSKKIYLSQTTRGTFFQALGQSQHLGIFLIINDYMTIVSNVIVILHTCWLPLKPSWAASVWSHESSWLKHKKYCIMHKYMYMRYLKPTLMQRLPCQALKHVGRTSPRHSKTNTTVVYKLHLRQTSLTLLVQNISTHGQQYQTASATIQISVVVRLAFHVGGWAIGLCPTPIKNISTETRHTFTHFSG